MAPASETGSSSAEEEGFTIYHLDELDQYKLGKSQLSITIKAKNNSRDFETDYSSKTKRYFGKHNLHQDCDLYLWLEDISHTN